MKIFSIAVGENGEVKMVGDLQPVQVKQLMDAILIQQAFEEGKQSILNEQKKEKEVKDASKDNQDRPQV